MMYCFFSHSNQNYRKVLHHLAAKKIQLIALNFVVFVEVFHSSSNFSRKDVLKEGDLLDKFPMLKQEGLKHGNFYTAAKDHCRFP